MTLKKISLVSLLILLLSCNEKISSQLSLSRTISSDKNKESSLKDFIADAIDELNGSNSKEEKEKICNSILEVCENSNEVSCENAIKLCEFIIDDDNQEDEDDEEEDEEEDDDEQEENDNLPIIDKTSLNSCNDWNIYFGLNDTYLCYQWHILANNQDVSTRGKAKTSDLRIGQVYSEFTGQGVRVHVTDSGMEYTHEDLKANYTQSLSRNYGISSTQNNHPVETDSHGTSVSGLIAATANNSVGVIGVGYGAIMSADNLISSYQKLTYFNDAYKKSSEIDIWNGSFGYSYYNNDTKSYVDFIVNHQERSDNSTLAAATIFGAENNNITYFKANGNDGNHNGADGNLEGQASVHVINTIAALGINNEVVSYSTPGANLALSGYAHLGGGSIGTCTTTTSNQYTCSFNGTSSASPTISGSAAVVLEALRSKVNNPRWTDLVYVLIKTANRNITDRISKYTGSIGTESKSSYKVTNSFGLEHSFDHGFGAVDVNAAVHEAKKYTNERLIPNPISKEYSVSVKTAINSNSCVDQEIDINDSLQIWSTEVSIDYEGISKKDIGIFLIMPDGKKALVKNTAGDHSVIKSLGYNQRFNVRSTMGINSQGVWKVRLCSRSGSGFFNGAKIKVFGFEKTDTLI